MPRRSAKKRANRYCFEWLEVRRLLTGHDTLATSISETLVQGVPSTIPGNVDDPNSADIYQLDLSIGQSLAANVDVPSISALQSYLRVFDATGTELVNSGNGSGNSSASYKALTTGIYYVGVSDALNTIYDPNTSGTGFGVTSGEYNLTLLVSPPNDTLATATPVDFVRGASTSEHDLIFDPRDADLFKLTLSQFDVAQLSVNAIASGSTLESRLRLFDSAGNELASNNNPGGDPSLTYEAATAGVYYVGISGEGNDSYDPHVPRSGVDASVGSFELRVLVNSPDPNNSLATAAPVNFIRGLSSSEKGQIVDPRDADIFKLALNKGDSAQLGVDALTSGSPLESRLRLFDAAGNELAADQTPGSDPSLVFHVTASGTYYVGISGAANAAYDPHVARSGIAASVGSFHLNVLVNSPPPVTQEVEPNNAIDDANSIALGTSVGGAIGTIGDQDFYLFTLTTAGRLTVSATPDSLSSLAPRLTLYGSDRRPSLSAVDLFGGAGATVQQHLPAGTYYVAVASTASTGAAATGGYHVSTSFIAATPPFADITIRSDSSPTQSNSNAVAIVQADLNGDGITDLVAANQFKNEVSVLLGLGDGTFRTAVTYQADQSPSAVVVADFNHDGHKDIAVANEISGDVSVLLGNGDGTFQSAVQYSVGGQPLALAVGHFTADGNLDLAVATADSMGGAGNVVILLGAGNGTFTTGGSFAVGVRPDAIVAAQFGNDPFTDLAVANRNADQSNTTLGPGSVSVLRGIGDGTFQTAVPYVVGDQPTSLAVGVVNDLNATGIVDLAVANAATQDVSLLVGQADGTFLQPATPIDLRNEPTASLSGDFRSAVLLGDFNGDGHLDLALANSQDTGVRVRVALGKGDGSFGPAQAVVVGGAPQALAAADFAGTGRLGLATADGNVGTVSVRLGLGDGSFQSPPQFNVGNEPNALVAADFNDDGSKDIAVANDGSPGGASVLLGIGDGTFQQQAQFAAGVSTAIATADFNGDGLTDLVTTNFDPNTQQSDLTVLLGLGDGRFRPAVHYAVGSDPLAVVTADFNGDGIPDIAVVNNSSNNVSILLGNGDGTFQPAVEYSVGSAPRGSAVGDFNGDRKLDLAVVNSGSNDVSILLGNGNGTFGSATQISVGSDPLGIVVGDFGNGHDDIATADSGSNDVSVLMNAGGGNFAPEVRFAAGTQPKTIVVGDFNGDKKLDLATANGGSNNVTVLIGAGSGTFAAPVSYAVGRSPSALIATDLNGDGRLDLACTNAGDRDVSVLLGIGDGTFVAPDKFSSNAIGSTPTLADVTGDGTPDSIVLSQAGQILVRPGRAHEPGAFDAARVVNPAQPARAFTIVRSGGRNLIAAVDRDFNTVSLYAIDAKGISTRVEQLQTDLQPNTGLQPVRIAAGDLTGDGRQDLVVANAGSGDVSIFLATAAGSFSALAPLRATDHPAEVMLVDLNGDNLPEIVLTDEVAGTVSVLVNQGGGSFAAAIHYRAATGQAGFELSATGFPTLLSLDGAGSFAAGAFTDGGATDLVVVNPGDASLSFLEGDGRGGFLNPRRIPVGTVMNQQRILVDARPAIVRAGRFFPNGHLDLAVLDADNHSITILRGDGHGNFQPAGLPAPYDAGNLPNGLSIDDFDRISDSNLNGIADLVVGNEFGDVMALPGIGDGTFAPFTRIGKRIAIAVGDVTGNGKQSWVVTDQTRDRLVVQVGGTTPGFTQDRSNGVVSPGAVKFADLNGDGIQDMIVVNSGGNNVLVYKGLGGGQFAAPVAFYSGTDPVDVQVGDLDHDPNDPHELPDVIVTNQGSNDVSIFRNVVQNSLDSPGGWLSLDRRFNVGAAPVATMLVPSKQPNQLPSLLVTNSGSNNVFMIPTIAGGLVADPKLWTTFNTGAAPQSAIVGNFFGGAGLDLVTLNYLSNTLTVYRDFNPNSRQDIGSGGVGPITALTGDFAQNGSLELVVGNNSNGALAIFAGTADGLVESDAIFSENLQHPVALALAAPGEGQELRLLAADEGDESVRVFSRESVLQPAKLADNDFSTGGLPGFSIGLGSFAVLFSGLAGAVESGAGELFVGIDFGTSAGGSSMNLPSLRDFSVDQFATAVSHGTKWIESAIHTILNSAGLHNVPDGAVEVLESVLDAAAPQVPWQALHQFFDGLLHASAPNQKGAPKPTVVDQVFETTGAERTIDSAVESLLFGDEPQSTADSGGVADWLADLFRMATEGTATLPPASDGLIRQQLFDSAANTDFDCSLRQPDNLITWRESEENLSPRQSDLNHTLHAMPAKPTVPAPSNGQLTDQGALDAECLLPGMIAVALAGAPGLTSDRLLGEFISTRPMRSKSPGGGHAKRD